MDNLASIGNYADSFFEYLMKAYILFGYKDTLIMFEDSFEVRAWVGVFGLCGSQPPGRVTYVGTVDADFWGALLQYCMLHHSKIVRRSRAELMTALSELYRSTDKKDTGRDTQTAAFFWFYLSNNQQTWSYVILF